MFVPALAFAILTAAAAPASPDPLDRLVGLITEGKCDDAFLLLAQVKPERPTGADDTQTARAVSKGAAGCRAADPLLALEFTALALRLAPADLEVALGHAEGLLAVDQRGEAAALLDRLVAANPAEKAPAAWLMRGKLAAGEAEHELVVRLLSPLAQNPALKAEVEPLLAESRAELREREQRQVALADAEAGAAVVRSRAEAKLANLPASTPTPTPKPTVTPGWDPPGIPGFRQGGSKAAPATHTPGAVVGTYPGSIGRRGRTTFTVEGLVPGRGYVFLATGNCNRISKVVEHEGWQRRRYQVRRKRTDAAVSGIDFRVSLGSQPSRSIVVGQNGGLDQSRIRFIADASEMQVTVFDESSLQFDDEASCSVSGFAVEAE